MDVQKLHVCICLITYKKVKKNIQCDKCFTFRESSINKSNFLCETNSFIEKKNVCKSKNALQRHKVEDCKRIIIYMKYS